MPYNITYKLNKTNYHNHQNITYTVLQVEQVEQLHSTVVYPYMFRYHKVVSIISIIFLSHSEYSLKTELSLPYCTNFVILSQHIVELFPFTSTLCIIY